MGDAVLGRTAPLTISPMQNGASLTLEAFVGIAKLRIHGTDMDAALSRAVGVSAPAIGRSVAIGETSCAWLGPGEWLLIGPEADVAALAGRYAEILADAIALAVDLTHARAVFTLAGPAARDRIAAHCPLDLSDAVFTVGAVARSLLGEAALFVERLGDEGGDPRFRVIVDQTMAGYAARLIGGIQ